MFRLTCARVTLSGASVQNMQHKFRNIKLHRKQPAVNTFLKRYICFWDAAVTALETDFRGLPQRLVQDWFSQAK